MMMDDSDFEIIQEIWEIKNQVKYDMAGAIKSGERYFPRLIPAAQYNRAISEFVKYGMLMRFPRKKIVQWKYMVAESISALSYITELFGHTSCFDTYDFHDVWLDEEEEVPENFDEAFTILMERFDPNEELFPTFSNGQEFMSDYGLQPLEGLLIELFRKDTEEEMLVVINRILDVTHPRSDLAEIFIEGGSKTLTAISEGVFI